MLDLTPSGKLIKIFYHAGFFIMKRILFGITLLCLFSCTHTKSKNKKNNQPSATKVTTVAKESAVVEVSADTFKKIILKAKHPVILDVYADWCPPCQRMAPLFEETAKELKDQKITFAKIKMESFESSDQHIKLLKELLDVTISMIPTLLVIEKGKVVDTLVGSQTKEQLNQKAQEFMKDAKKLPKHKNTTQHHDTPLKP